MAIAVAAIAVILLAGPKQKKIVKHPPNDDPWLLVSYDPDTKYGTYLGNGFISTRIMGDGVGSQDGKPLPCFMAGLYDNEKLVPIPTWSDLRFYDGEKQFKIDKSAPYKQVLNMKTGILTTHATWRAGDKTLKGKIEVIVSRARPNVGLVRAVLTPGFTGDITVTFLGHTPQGSESSAKDGVIDGFIYKIKSAGLYVGFSRATWMENGFSPGSHSLGPMMSSPVNVRNGVSAVMETFTALHVGKDAGRVGRAAGDEVKSVSGWDASDPQQAHREIIFAHKAAWAKLWQRDIIIDGPRKDQQAIHSCMFYLLQSVREGSQWSIPPMGLSADSFSGHVFWDADTWMFPALILQHPELARSIVDYRYNTLHGAIANAKASGYKGAQYAWESGYTGKEDVPVVEYRSERHINGDVALAQWQYYLATGDLNWLRTRGYPVIKATADYWLSRVVYVPEKDRCEIKRVVPPDESAGIIDNSVYTNAIARMNLEIASRAAELIGLPINPRWQFVAGRMYIPFDEKSKRFIEFDGYRGIPIKQADPELLAYPLQIPMPAFDTARVYRNTLDYYAPKVMPKGPAMTHSAHAVIRARLGDCDAAYKDFVRSYKPYLRGGLNYFNETPSEFRDNYCFLTGCAGPIQATLFGFAGARMDYFPADPSKADLTYKPCLPGQWKSLKITGVQWRGKAFDLTVTQGNKATITKQ